MLESDQALIDEQAERIAALEATNAKMWADFDALKVTVLANERAKDAENERLRAALKPFADCVYNDNGDITVTTRDVRTHDYFRAYRTLRGHTEVANAYMDEAKRLIAEADEQGGLK